MSKNACCPRSQKPQVLISIKIVKLAKISILRINMVKVVTDRDQDSKNPDPINQDPKLGPPK